MEAFGIEILATTDDPLDDLGAHLSLRADASFKGRVIPTFRPDAYVNAHAAEFAGNVDRLIEVAGEGRHGYDGYLSALRNRRQHFIDAGAVATDHGVRTPLSLKIDPLVAARLFDRVRRGDVSEEDRDAFEAHMLYEMARMSVEDGLAMAIHPGSLRDYEPGAYARFGPDTGHDIPIAVEFTSSLRPLLADFGTARRIPFGAVHTGRDHLLARVGAVGRCVPTCSSGHRGGSSMRRTPCSASVRP